MEKKLIAPEFRITIGDYELAEGMEVECFSSKQSHLDWCKVELANILEGAFVFQNMDPAKVELGYDDDYDVLIDGYVRNESPDYWKEIMIKDDLMKLERTIIRVTFMDAEPQDVIRYILACAGITKYSLASKSYGKKGTVTIRSMNGLEAIGEVNSLWGISNPFYFQNGMFYWGSVQEQEEIYVIEENETILSLEKYGTLWQAEVIAIPWIHHSQKIEVRHSKYSGTVEVEQTIVKSDEHGAVHMFLFFKGG